MRSGKVQMIAILAIGSLIGYLAASGGPNWFSKASASPSEQLRPVQECMTISGDNTASCCSDSQGKAGTLAHQSANITPVAIMAMAPHGAVNQDGEETITFEILVPVDAVLELNGTKMDPTGESRRFVTPGLKTGGNYSYDVKVSSKGKDVTRKIQLRHGSSNTFDLRGDFQGGNAASPTTVAAKPASGRKPNILFIMGDDIGFMQPGCYHRGLMVGETPNIDRIAHEGGLFMDYVAMQSCTSGRCAFFTGMYPLRVGLSVPQLPGSPAWIRPGTPTIAKTLLNLGYTTGQFGKNHLGDHAESLPTAQGFQEFWGYLYHLDAMQQVSFPDINKTPTEQGVAPPGKNTPIPGLPEVPGSVDPLTNIALIPPRPMLSCTSSDGTQKNQKVESAGPLTLERSKTVDEEISAKVVDFLDRNDPSKTNKPFFCWYNPARMHVTTVLSPKYEAMLGVRGGKDWGANEVGMKQMDDNIGVVLEKLEKMGELDNTIVVFTTDNGAETVSFPDGGITPFKGQKGSAWEGGYRSPCVIRWPGHVKPGTIYKELFASLDWMPTLTEIAGGPKGNDLNKEIMAGTYPGFVKTTLDGVNQIDYLTGKSTTSARDNFIYYQGSTLSAVRYKNWKFYYTMASSSADGWITPSKTFNFTLVQNIKRDPFEQAVGSDLKSAGNYIGSLASPGTAFIYDWNLLPIGQMMALRHLESFEKYPPMQAPPSYNLAQVMEQIQAQKRAIHNSGHPSE